MREALGLHDCLGNKCSYRRAIVMIQQNKRKAARRRLTQAPNQRFRNKLVSVLVNDVDPRVARCVFTEDASNMR